MSPYDINVFFGLQQVAVIPQKLKSRLQGEIPSPTEYFSDWAFAV